MNVLTVDDDRDQSQFLALALPLEDPTVDVRARRSFLSVSDADCEWADVALVDWMMPDANGAQVIDRIVATNPDVRPFVLSAAASTYRVRTPYRVLLKPLTVREILDVLHGDDDE